VKHSDTSSVKLGIHVEESRLVHNSWMNLCQCLTTLKVKNLFLIS